MIYEFRTYQISTGSLNNVLDKFREKIDERNKISKIGAFWYTEIGPLNEIIHVWPYDDMEHRNRSREQAIKEKVWPPDSGKYMVSMNTEFWKPVSFSPQWKERHIGPFFEMRIYTFPYNEIDKMLTSWEKKIDARNKLAPLVGRIYFRSGRCEQIYAIYGPTKVFNIEQRQEKNLHLLVGLQSQKVNLLLKWKIK